MSGPTVPTDVMPGAEPFAFPGGDGPDGRTGVLLVHGFTGTPMSMRPWGEHLAAEGFAVRCPLLPGHGTRWQDCNASTHDQWTTAVGEAFDDLAAECDRVFVAGLSMGGTLATRLAEVRPDDVAGLAAGQPGAAHPAAGREAAADDRQDHRQLGADRQRHQEARHHRAGLPEAADAGDDAAARRCGPPPAPTSPGSPRR